MRQNKLQNISWLGQNAIRLSKQNTIAGSGAFGLSILSKYWSTLTRRLTQQRRSTSLSSLSSLNNQYTVIFVSKHSSIRSKCDEIIQAYLQWVVRGSYHLNNADSEQHLHFQVEEAEVNEADELEQPEQPDQSVFCLFCFKTLQC